MMQAVRGNCKVKSQSFSKSWVLCTRTTVLPVQTRTSQKKTTKKRPPLSHPHHGLSICYLAATDDKVRPRVYVRSLSSVSSKSVLQGSPLANSCSRRKRHRARAISDTACPLCRGEASHKSKQLCLACENMCRRDCGKAAHRRSGGGLKESPLINERQSGSQSERNSLPQFFKQALPAGLYCLDRGIMGSSIYRF